MTRDAPLRSGARPSPSLAWMVFDVLVEVRLRAGHRRSAGRHHRAQPAHPRLRRRHGVRVGKAIRFSIDAADEPAARAEVEQLCSRFLTNPVIEDAVVSMEPGR